MSYMLVNDCTYTERGREVERGERGREGGREREREGERERGRDREKILILSIFRVVIHYTSIWCIYLKLLHGLSCLVSQCIRV